MKRRFESLQAIYARTEELQASASSSQDTVHEEALCTPLLDLNCPTLSPPRVREEGPSHPSGDVPSSSESASETSYLHLHDVLSPKTEMEVDSVQGQIEEEVFKIAKATGFELYNEEAHVLGQWVHGESSNPSTLHAILQDLREKREHSEWFESAKDAFSHQFVGPNNPLEKFAIPLDFSFLFTNPSLFMLLTLSLVLLLVHFVKGRGGRA